MKKVISVFAATGLLVGLSQLGLAQHGQLTLVSENSGLSNDEGIYYAGSLNMTWTPDGGSSESVVAYCTTLNIDAFFGNTWGAFGETTDNFTPEPPSDTAATEALYALNGENDLIVGREMAFLADTFGGSSTGSVLDNQNDAATQLAIWDIAIGGNGTAGDAFFSRFGSPDALVFQAEGLASIAFAAKYTLLDKDIWYKADLLGNGQPASQDFLAPNSTPEPFTMGIGALGIGLALRRRLKRNA